MPLTLIDGGILTVEMALSADVGVFGAWDAAAWGSDAWGPDTVWTDVSAWVRSAQTRRGFSRDLQIWQTGTANVVLDNNDARFSPANLTGPYATAGVTQVRPWRPIRIRVTWAGVSYDLYRGYVVDWTEAWTEASPGAGDAYVTVSCVDEWARLAGFDGLEQSPTGGGETAGQRAHRILDNAAHTGDRDIDPGVTTVQATTLAVNAATELALTADSEGGAVYVSASGAVVFEQRFALIDNSRSGTVQSTWGDGPGELPYSDIQVANNGDLLVNIASWARVGSTAQTVTDPSSRALYGDRRSARTDLMCETDGQVALLAAWQVARYKDPEFRVTGVEIRPRNLRYRDQLYPQVLGRQVRDLVRVRRQVPGGVTVSRDVHIAGITHVITKDNWVTSWDLWSATYYQNVGRWDSATWGTSTWFL